MSELSYEASDEASENELLDRSLSVWRGWGSIREDFTPIPLDIHTASSIGQYDCVRTLIARGEVEIDRKNVGGWTPLMYACYIGHDHIASLLIDAGCNVNLRNQRGQTPLMLAASCGNESVGRILLRKGAELEAVDKNGWTALFHATYSGHQNFVSFLLDTRANMDAVEPRTGLTPLMTAAIEGHEIIVQLFLQHGVNVNTKAFNGDTARSLALMYSYMKIVSLIDNHVMPHSSLRSEPGLGDYLSSSDELDKRQRPQHQRSSRTKFKAGPSIRDGPEAIARMIDRTRTTDHHVQRGYPQLVVPRGYMPYPNAGEGELENTQLSYRDVTSPINQEDYHLDSSGGKDYNDDNNDDSNAFSKTGFITIKSSSSSSGGLIAALGISRQNSADSDEFRLHDSGVHNSSQSENDNGNNDGDVVGDGGDDGGDNVGDVSSKACEREKKDDEEKEREGEDAAAATASQKVVETGKIETAEGGISKDKVDADISEVDKAGKISKLSKHDYHGVRYNLSSTSSNPPASLKITKLDNAPPTVKNIAKLESKPETALASASVENLDGDAYKNTETDVYNKADSNVYNPHPFQAGFTDVIFPDSATELGGNSDENVVGILAIGQAAGGPTAHADRYLENLLMEGKMAAAGSGGGDGDGFEMQAGGGGEGRGGIVGLGSVQFSNPPPPSHHRHNNGRSSRRSVPDRETGSVPQPKDSRHRRKSANSPPTFHREYGGRGHDLGSGTGRVSCLSDIPSNPGPQAGYPVTSCSRQTGDRYYGNSQVPVAAVAPTFLPPSSVAAGNSNNSSNPLSNNNSNPLSNNNSSGSNPNNPSNHPPPPNPTSSAFSTLSSQQQPPSSSSSSSSFQRKNSAPDITTTTTTTTTHPSSYPSSPTPSTRPLTTNYQSDSGVGRGGRPNNPHSRLSELVRELPSPGVVGGEGQGQCDLPAVLEQLGLSKYVALFAEQDVDLQVFLSLTDNDLKEIGIKLFGPRKKMTNAIARWHSQAPAARSSLEQAYADRLEGEMQEMAIQLNQAYSSVEKLQAQVLQERQLRSVTEGCLMEERGGWQRVHQSLLDTQQRCSHFAEAVAKLGSFHAEIKQRLAAASNTPFTPTSASASPTNNTLPAGCQASDLVAMTAEQLTQASEQCLFELRQHSGALKRALDCIVNTPPVVASAVQEGREGEHGFP